MGGLTGFLLVGKPGGVVVEGEASKVEAYVRDIKNLPWKRFQVRLRESEEISLAGDDGGGGGEADATGRLWEALDARRAFGPMVELELAVHGPRGNHSDLAELRTLLESKGLGHGFGALFQVDHGGSPSTSGGE